MAKLSSSPIRELNSPLAYLPLAFDRPGPWKFVLTPSLSTVNPYSFWLGGVRILHKMPRIRYFPINKTSIQVQHCTTSIQVKPSTGNISPVIGRHLGIHHSAFLIQENSPTVLCWSSLVWCLLVLAALRILQ